MPTSEFGGDLLLPFAILGLAMTVGYAVWAWQRAKKRRDGTEGVPLRRNRLEEELRAELDAVRRRREAEEAGDAGALDLTDEQRRERERVRAMVERNGE